MHESPLIGETCAVAQMDLRHGGKIEILTVKADDAIVINGSPTAFIDDAVAKGVEALVADVVPAHLGHTLGFFGLFVHISFQLFVFLLFLKEAEVAFSLYLVFEAVQLGDIHLTQFDGLADAVLVLQLENTGGVLVIGNQEQRPKNEVCPFAFPALLVDVIVMAATPIETVALQLVRFLHGFPSLLLLQSPGSIRKGCTPDGGFLELAFKVAEQRGLHDIVLHMHQQVADLTDDTQLVVIRAVSLIVFIGIPKDEVPFGQ